jgi:hypothetical protein
MPHYKKLLEVEQIPDVHNRIFNRWNYYSSIKEQILKIINSEYGWDMEYEQFLFDEYETFFRKIRIVPERASKSPASYKRLLRQFNLWDGPLKKKLDDTLNGLAKIYRKRKEKDQQLISVQRDDLSSITEADERYFQWYLKKDKLPKKVYRGDGRSITAQFFNNFNFESILPGGIPDISFRGVVEHTHTSTQKNGMVSTTTDKRQAYQWAVDNHNYGVVYRMKVRNYVNVAELLAARNFRDRFAAQLEILIPGKIMAEEVETVTLYHLGAKVQKLKNTAI